ncbi:MAG TPA: hypothetical protein VMM79_05855, partial [Longimicrobiales bacterium]|nr:hypothetical protein [Longimicrobiales bacterium]
GISQPTLSRLARGKSRQIESDTFERLRRLVPRDRWRMVEQATVSMEAAMFLRSYKDWLDGWLSRVLRAKPTPMTTEVDGRLKYQGRSEVPPAEYEEEYRDLKALLMREHKSVVTGFYDAVENRGHDEARAELGLRRALEPALEGRASGGVERGWREFSKEEMRRFLSAGLRRERILLNRKPALARARSNAAFLVEFLAGSSNRLPPSVFIDPDRKRGRAPR